MEVARRKRSLCSSRRRRSAAVGRKVRELRRLVPGAAVMPTDRLLVRTADYIAQLRARVELLRALSELCEGHGRGDSPS
ncbi:transcription factor bHLH150-like [Triticum dicoccoides]|uniref:transcription factor bHLH150-like n=1 Tax=Triticum dicoccoides TaxID=85692 RepID=UPI000E78E2EC|nr:transcription factor bHLH150-like [Triticum dicoccoides]